MLRESREAGGGREGGEGTMAGQAALMASASVRNSAPLACSPSGLYKLGVDSDASRCGE